MKIKSYGEVVREKREILKSSSIEHEKWEPHQRKGVPPPPLEKEYNRESVLAELAKSEATNLGDIPLAKAIKQRESRRKYTLGKMNLGELSFLLWATQGVKSVDKDKVWTKRTVPSGGARHPFETYLIVNRVEGLEPGVYRYLPIEHKLLLVDNEKPLPSMISEACLGQTFVEEAAVVFVWTVIPYRTEWRYSVISYKGILVDVGHVCQNLYLACEAICAGTCAILAYDQKKMDSLIGVDGEDEFTIYLAPVGKI